MCTNYGSLVNRRSKSKNLEMGKQVKFRSTSGTTTVSLTRSQHTPR